MTIATISKNPALPLAPEPPPFVVPRMGGPPRVDAAPAKAWRVTEAELEEIMSWLVPRLQEKYPQLSQHGLNFVLRDAMFSTSAILVRTAKVVGLARLPGMAWRDYSFVVEEDFVRSREPANEEACDLYRFIRDWAVSIGACEFRFNRDSDCAMTHHVAPALQDVKKNFKVRKDSVFTLTLKD